MSNHTSRYELPRNIERYLATISKLYAQVGDQELQGIIVNSQTRIHEAWSSDNWNGGTYGHALYLLIPEALFLSVVDHKSEIQVRIRDDINRVHNVQNEFIEEVFLELAVSHEQDWRSESGLLISSKRTIATEAKKRVWQDGGFRVFLSHKSEVKVQTATLRDQLKLFHVSCFVAHEDIHPTKAWQDEIENALSSMDGFVALLTSDFHESEWTDQEVGFAFARGVPLIAVRLGRDPYGFIGKFQGLRATWDNAAVEIVKILVKHDRMFSAYIDALRNCPNWGSGNILAEVLPSIEKLSRHQVDSLIDAYNNTSELWGSFGFNGSRPSIFGWGLVHHLNRLDTSREFRFSPKRLVEVVE